MLALINDLRKAGVMGINDRNANFVLPYNQRRYYPLVDDKLQTKKVAEAAGVSVPPLYGVVEINRQIRDLSAMLAPYTDFVVKPANGSQGEGILVITGKAKGGYRKASGTVMKEDEMAYHLTNVLSGIYSLGGQPDKALIEYRVKFDPVFDQVSYLGVPDIRIIVFLGVPVMAMIRLPTRLSDGKANLHQGAIGAGIDIASGRTLTAVWRNSIITEHPDTGVPVSGLEIPQWETMLQIATRTYELTHLGYQGVDIVLDRDLGPLILEINARPGLNIQLANRAGLRPRLDLVESAAAHLTTIGQRVAFAREHFKGESA